MVPPAALCHIHMDPRSPCPASATRAARRAAADGVDALARRRRPGLGLPAAASSCATSAARWRAPPAARCRFPASTLLFALGVADGPALAAPIRATWRARSGLAA